jgi:hypothetical protein
MRFISPSHGHCRIRRAGLVALALSLNPIVAGLNSSWASSPNHPIAIIGSTKLGATPLDLEVSVNITEVSTVTITSVVNSGENTLLTVKLPERLFPSQAHVSVEQRIPAPEIPFHQLENGVFARTVEVAARLRTQTDQATKPLAVSRTDYFRVEGGNVFEISAEEYTAIGQPPSAIQAEDGTIRVSQPGSGQDIGITRRPRPTQSVEGKTADSVPGAARRGGRR